ncbi:hypothetical protein [Mycobacterium sp. D16R24]|uniref:hypothetical protein n=1 Tax=Mycobacterium sp. D16R24 TaxID=1855656 RepID=UPI0009932C6A|nr:hypothetical protein [Mycobacterium sp. D16R24]
MSVPDRLADLSQRITTLTGLTLTRAQAMSVVSRAFEHQVDLDDDGQLRALVAGLASPATVSGPPVPDPQPEQPTGPGNDTFGIAQPAVSYSPAQAEIPRLDPSSQPSSPSGATAKTMAVLALLGGIVNLASAVLLVAAGSYLSDQDTMPGWYHATTYAIAACGFVAAGALLAGGVMTFKRQRFGPRIVATACVLGIAVFFGDLAATLTAAHDTSATGISTSPIHYLASLIMPVATLVLALLPSTTWWVIHGAAVPPNPPTAIASAPGNRRTRWAIIAGAAVLVVAVAGTVTYVVTQRNSNASDHCDKAVAVVEDVARFEFEFTGRIDQALPALKERLSPEQYREFEPRFEAFSSISGKDQVTTHLSGLTSKLIECSGTTAHVESRFTVESSSPASPAPQNQPVTQDATLEYQKDQDRWIVTKFDTRQSPR